MRRWPLPCTAEPRLVVRPVARKISASLPALARCRSRGRLRSGSVPSRKASAEELGPPRPRWPLPELDAEVKDVWSPTSCQEAQSEGD